MKDTATIHSRDADQREEVIDADPSMVDFAIDHVLANGCTEFTVTMTLPDDDAEPPKAA